MAFVLSNKTTFKFKVKVRRPGNGETGDFEAFDFVGEFKRLPQAEVDKLMRNPPVDTRLVADDVEADGNVFLGWSGVKHVVNVDGKDVEQELLVTPTNRLALLAEAGVRTAIVLAYRDAVLLGPLKN